MAAAPAALAPTGGAYTPGANPGAPWADASKYGFRTWFAYELDTTAALAPNGTANLSFNIAGDSDFFWTKFCLNAVDSTGAGGYIPADVTLQLTNTTSGRNYMTAPVPVDNIAGIGALPFILPMVTLWEAKSTIQAQLANTGGTGATYNILNMTFIGIKAFFR